MAGTGPQNGNNAAGNNDFSRRAMELAAQQAETWRTPHAQNVSGRGEYADPEKIIARKEAGHQFNLSEQVALWMTPNVPNGGRSAAHATMIGRTAMHEGKKVQIGLEHQVKQWPTPTASDHKGSGPTLERSDGKMRGDRLDYATEQIFSSPPAPETDAGPKSLAGRRILNPLFVEWLMGWPIGWTDSAPVETGLSRWLLLMRGRLSMLCSPKPSDQVKLF